MTFLSPTERHTLTLICETFAPSITPETGDDPRVFAFSGSDVNLAAAVETGLEVAADADGQRQVRLILAALENHLLNRVSVGIGKGFSVMTPAERDSTMRAWSSSPIPAARQGFQVFKRLTLFLHFGLALPNGRNPLWDHIGYAPPPMADRPRTLSPLDINRDTTLSADVVIIGSGAGGGVVAGELAAAGWDVLVVEKGGYHADGDFHGRELDSTQALYEKQGSMASKDLQIALLAGSTLGGGTTVNWAGSLHTPDQVRAEWARDYGFSAAVTDAYTHSLDAVCDRMGVSTNESAPNEPNCKLIIGATALGYDTALIPRNTHGCMDENGTYRCGFCNFGCRYGAKQGTMKTFLQDAADHGGRVVVNAYAERVTVERGCATGAILRVTGRDGRTHRVTVKSKIVVAAGGAFNTPALLLRSGLQNPNIGANLHLHPTTPVYAVFDEPIRAWEGAPMTRIMREFADLDGAYHGVRLETAPLHPAISAFATGWTSARQHRRVIQRLDHLSNIVVLARDKHTGRVTLDKHGDPVVDYRLHRHDAAHLMRGVIEALRILHAAGAVEVASPHGKHMPYYVQPEKVAFAAHNQYADFEMYLRAVQAEGLKPNTFALFSAHQMSSARIGGNAKLGAFDPSGESYEVKNLFVGDGSALPSASGVNPMVSIMGMAHYIAQQIKVR